jgi:hypothetical protein
MSSYISAELRRLVEERAGGACEYCRIREVDTFVGCHVDRIIAEKHGGLTVEGNLAYSCAVCNRAKGTDIASRVPGTDKLVRLFNPRIDRWDDHFRIDLDSLEICPLTDVGGVTVKVLALNQIERVLERVALVEVGHYPVSRRPPR